MFSLIYSSRLPNVFKKHDLIESLKIQRANADISRTISPQDICVTVNQDILNKYPAFVKAIKDADTQVQLDREEHFGNYYSGVGIDLNKTEMLSLIQYHDFNQTIIHYHSIDKQFFYQDTLMECGFQYNNNNYDLRFTFTMLENVTGGTGYVGIHITKQASYAGSYWGAHTGMNAGKTFASFNNTIVFFNELPSTVTIDIKDLNDSYADSIVIPPSKIQDIGLNPHWNSKDDALYHYEVREYPSINGEIAAIKSTTDNCMSNKVAKSLYQQKDMAVQFPSYLPDGFALACNSENTNYYLEQVYANQTAYDNYYRLGIIHSQINPFAYYLYPTMSKDELAGIFIIHAQKPFVNAAEDEVRNAYEQAVNGTTSYWTEPQYFTLNGTSYFTYHEGKLISDVDVAKEGVTYRVQGALPMSELVKVAESLS